MCDVGVGCMNEIFGCWSLWSDTKKSTARNDGKSRKVDKSKSNATSWPHAHTYKVTGMRDLVGLSREWG